ncbi:MAG: hypothetical protein QM765_21000 [Myxococcales bacterium]
MTSKPVSIAAFSGGISGTDRSAPSGPKKRRGSIRQSFATWCRTSVASSFAAAASCACPSSISVAISGSCRSAQPICFAVFFE